MKPAPRALRLLMYGTWTVVLTATTYVLGAIPLKILRTLLGRRNFWALGLVSCAVLAGVGSYALGLALLSLTLLVGVYDEGEDAGLSGTASAFFSLAVNALLATGGFLFWMYSVGPGWQVQAIQFIDAVQKPITAQWPAAAVDAKEFLRIAPSLVLALWMAALYLAVLLESRLMRPTGAKTPPPARAGLVREFRLPDPVIWLFIGSLLGRFGDFGSPVLQMVAYNVLNVCLVLFFFQGLAVIAKYFETIRLNPAWQVVLMLFLVYLSLFVSLLGLMDYWLDFRARFTKPASTFNREA